MPSPSIKHKGRNGIKKFHNSQKNSGKEPKLSAKQWAIFLNNAIFYDLIGRSPIYSRKSKPQTMTRKNVEALRTYSKTPYSRNTLLSRNKQKK